MIKSNSILIFFSSLIFSILIFSCKLKPKVVEDQKVIVNISLSGNQNKDSILSNYKKRIKEVSIKLEESKITSDGIQLTILMKPGYRTDGLSLLFSSSGLVSLHRMVNLSELDATRKDLKGLTSDGQEIWNRPIKIIDTSAILQNLRKLQANNILSKDVGILSTPSKFGHVSVIPYYNGSEKSFSLSPNKFELIMYSRTENNETISLDLNSLGRTDLADFIKNNLDNTILVNIDSINFDKSRADNFKSGRLTIFSKAPQGVMSNKFFLTAAIMHPILDLNIQKIEIKNLSQYYPTESQLKRYAIIQETLNEIAGKLSISYHATESGIDMDEMKLFYSKVEEQYSLVDAIRLTDLSEDQVEPMLRFVENEAQKHKDDGDGDDLLIKLK